MGEIKLLRILEHTGERGLIAAKQCRFFIKMYVTDVNNANFCIIIIKSPTLYNGPRLDCILYTWVRL